MLLWGLCQPAENVRRGVLLEVGQLRLWLLLLEFGE